MTHFMQTPQTAIVSAFFWLSAVLGPLAAAAAESVELQADPSPNPTRVHVVLEVDGQLLGETTQKGAAPPSHSLKAKGDFLYEERRAVSDAASGIWWRHYEQAEGEIAVDGRPVTSQLRAARQFIAVQSKLSTSEGVGVWSPQGALTRQELDLLELPGGSHLVDQLLPVRTVEVGQTWTHDDRTLARLLNLSAVTANEITSQLSSIDREKQLAQLTLDGKLIGSAGGVLSEIELQGKYTFDLQRKRITWLALGIKEQRSPGLAKPGLDVRARLRMVIEERVAEQLSDAAVESFAKEALTPTELLEFEAPEGQFTLTHDRRWHVYSIRPELIVLRLIDDDQLIAQCNLHTVPIVGAGHRTTLAQFQNEIRTALGNSAQQVIDANESTLPRGIRQLRVAVLGKVSEVPIQWIYYQISTAESPSVTCVFTMSGDNVEQFGAEDVTLVGNISLNTPTENSSASATTDELR